MLCKVIAHQGLDPTTATAAQMALARLTAKESYLVQAFIMGVDCTQFGHLLENYKNNFTPGLDRYPKTHTDAYNEEDPESERTSQLFFEFALQTQEKDLKPKKDGSSL